MKDISIKEKLLIWFQNRPGQAFAIHEIKIDYMGMPVPASENNLATRCSELAREGKISGRFRKNKNYKEWGCGLSAQEELFW